MYQLSWPRAKRSMGDWQWSRKIAIAAASAPPSTETLEGSLQNDIMIPIVQAG